MTAYKNQHYIPQFYLKNFASDDLGKAINLYNLKSKKHIRNVPIRHQASRDYFYGKDLKIENFLAKLETEIGSICRNICRHEKIAKSQKEMLRMFFASSYARTDSQRLLLLQATDGIRDDIIKRGTNVPKIDPMDYLLKMIYRIHHVLADIDICLIKNATTVDFVVTDAIASRYNFYLERRKKEFMGYRASFSAIGLVLCIPITPRLLLLGFDSEAYYLLGNVIKNRADAHAINEIQYLNSYTNIYYKSETSEKNIDKYDDQLASQKPSQRVITSSFKEDKKTETGIFYKPVNEEDSMSSEPIVYVSSQANTDANIGFELLNEKSAVWNPQVNRLATRPHVQKLENIPRSSLRADPSIIWE